MPQSVCWTVWQNGQTRCEWTMIGLQNGVWPHQLWWGMHGLQAGFHNHMVLPLDVAQSKNETSTLWTGKDWSLPKEYMALAMYRLALYSTSYLIGMPIVIVGKIIIHYYFSSNIIPYRTVITSFTVTIIQIHALAIIPWWWQLYMLLKCRKTVLHSPLSSVYKTLDMPLRTFQSLIIESKKMPHNYINLHPSIHHLCQNIPVCSLIMGNGISF